VAVAVVDMQRLLVVLVVLVVVLVVFRMELVQEEQEHLDKVLLVDHPRDPDLVALLEAVVEVELRLLVKRLPTH
jgi:hypothetical protein